MVTQLTPFSDFRDAKVLITGHTGFKGAWLALWLKHLGARVCGFALSPEDGQTNLFNIAGVNGGLESIIGDLRNQQAVSVAFEKCNPDIVLHLAAQSLVRRSYQQPVETYATNVMGTVHVLEAARRASSLKAVVIVTSDKCYRNLEQYEGYQEDDAMGGADPYSSSKGCAELVVEAYRHSFFSSGSGPLIASARAGNVIGGGDWCEDRLVPDIAKAIANDTPVVIRNPDAIRPWQHVLEPLRGYLMLAARLVAGQKEFAEGWNFGPNDDDAIPVIALAQKIVAHWGKGTLSQQPDHTSPHEAGILKLNIEKSRSKLGYHPVLDVNGAIALSADWYRAYLDDPTSAALLCENQINSYMEQIS